MDSALDVVIQVLKNEKTPKISNQKYQVFLQQEIENILFLISRIVYITRKVNPWLKVAIEFGDDQHIYHAQDPTIWLVKDVEHKNDIDPIISCYENEFPNDVLNKKLVIATRVFVAQSLASWSFYYKDQTKLANIVNVGLQRIKKDNNTISFQNKKLSIKSTYLIYFVTHVVLVATMWGELHYPVGGSHNIWVKIINQFKKWILKIHKFAPHNLEIWLELLFCLELLHENEFVDQYTDFTFSLYSPICKIKNQHEAYHTYILWALYFAAVHVPK